MELLNEKIISKKGVNEMIAGRGWEGGVLEVLAEKYLDDM